MSEEMIAYCGLTCTDCKAYIATQKNDVEALRKMAEEASKSFGMTLMAEDAMCDGCLGNGRKIGYCNTCEVRACAMDAGILNCAHCDDYGCEVITAFLAHSEEAKTTLETIRRAL